MSGLVDGSPTACITIAVSDDMTCEIIISSWDMRRSDKNANEYILIHFLPQNFCNFRDFYRNFTRNLGSLALVAVPRFLTYKIAIFLCP